MIAWDEEHDGRSRLPRFIVCVDGEQRMVLRELENGDGSYLQIFAVLEFEAGKNELWITPAHDWPGTAASNLATVSV